MDNTPTASRRVPDPDNAAVSARLAVIEGRLDEIINHLDELKHLLMVLQRAQPAPRVHL